MPPSPQRTSSGVPGTDPQAADQTRARSPSAERPWRVAMDTGGTFTDAIAIDPDGRWHRCKVPSDGSIPCRLRATPGHPRRGWVEVPEWWPEPTQSLRGAIIRWAGERGAYEARVIDADADGWLFDQPLPEGAAIARAFLPGPLESGATLDAPAIAIAALTGVAPGGSLPPIELRLSTTRGTNALLERRGARTALLVTRGFEDLLEIGDQSRPELFALSIRKRDPLCEIVLPLDERVLADGTVRRPLDPGSLVAPAIRRALEAEGIESVAVACLHGLASPAHERTAVEAIRAAYGVEACAAGELSDSPRFLSRAETAVVHASLVPVMRRYLTGVAPSVPATSTFVMTSAGGLQRADRFLARDSLLSGPAGGVAGIAEIARRLGRTRLLGLDMGGTSTDVARYDGGFAYRYETRVGGARVAAPAIAIESVAAGGGSICHMVRGELHVGQASAGARPGPACYGFGGPLTLTDVNLLLGRMDEAMGSIPLDRGAAERALDRLADEVARQRGSRPARGDLLDGLIAIADERMAAAIGAVTVREGADPRDYALVAFGGAGGQHACSLAERLGIGEVLFPLDAGILSARGVLGAAVERFASRALLAPLDACAGELAEVSDALGLEAVAAVAAELPHAAGTVRVIARTVAIRLEGQDQALSIPFGHDDGAAALPAAFDLAFRHLYGYPPPRRRLVVEAMRVVAAVETPLSKEPPKAPVPPGVSPAEKGIVRDRSSLAPSTVVHGPCLLIDGGATAYLPPGWIAEVLPSMDLLARPLPDRRRGTAKAPASAELDLFACRLEAIATSMGELLRRTAFSTNVKERLDYSCALLDADGTLLQNAPHLPVHLGAMGVCVRGVAAQLALGPGDVAITNHPAFGGSHLPDVTLVTPVFLGTERVGYVANRAHHAEIGGTRPGSFPPNASSLAEEGVVLPPLHLVRGGSPQWEEIERLLRGSPYPSRAVEENLADLQAALAANAHGAEAFQRLAEHYGLGELRRLAESMLTRSERALRAALRRVGPLRRQAIERLDDGARIAVDVTIDGDRARIDFSGSATVHPRSFNAPAAVARAATLYVLRLLVGEDIAMNEGLLRPIELVLPTGMLNPPFEPDPERCPPVVAGNTETSQRVTDALLRAFGLCAGSQGTMNNLLFGNARYGAYETICGGSGATEEAPGASAVHTHMTNTRITDPEVLERRCPVVVRRFARRRGSGGRGAMHGGDGAIREIEFLEATQVSLLAQHRVERPYGMAGGEPGEVGRQWHVDRLGRTTAIPGVAAIDCDAGEAIRVETPGGGGWGAADDALKLAQDRLASSEDHRGTGPADDR